MKELREQGLESETANPLQQHSSTWLHLYLEANHRLTFQLCEPLNNPLFLKVWDRFLFQDPPLYLCYCLTPRWTVSFCNKDCIFHFCIFHT